MTAGYSGTPLPVKLGIGPDKDVLLLGDPLSFDLTVLGRPVDTDAGDDGYDVVLLFCPSTATLAALFGQATTAQRTDGAVWVCWPKKSSGVPTDLTENAVRDYGLTHGRVDVKVAAVDATWSGLKFMTRLRDR